MATAVIGATGRVGSDIVRAVLAHGEAVTALVRDPAKPATPSRRVPSRLPGGIPLMPRASARARSTSAPTREYAGATQLKTREVLPLQQPRRKP
jgi:nucleoside-diphosphate-sugar epimerase